MKTLRNILKRACTVIGKHAYIEVAHVAYFGAVFVEAHGFYGHIAGGLLILTVANFFGED